jgi:hypothetical protein
MQKTMDTYSCEGTMTAQNILVRELRGGKKLFGRHKFQNDFKLTHLAQ